MRICCWRCYFWILNGRIFKLLSRFDFAFDALQIATVFVKLVSVCIYNSVTNGKEMLNLFNQCIFSNVIYNCLQNNINEYYPFSQSVNCLASVYYLLVDCILLEYGDDDILLAIINLQEPDNIINKLFACYLKIPNQTKPIIKYEVWNWVSVHFAFEVLYKI